MTEIELRANTADSGDDWFNLSRNVYFVFASKAVKLADRFIGIKMDKPSWKIAERNFKFPHSINQSIYQQASR